MRTKQLFLFVILAIGLWSGQAAAQCPSYAGIIDTGDYVLCSNGSFQIYNTNSVLDSNDIRLYIIHTGTATQIGAILWSSTSPFISSFPPAMQTGQPYQVAVVVGNALSANTIDFTDPCLSIAGGLTITLQQGFSVNAYASGQLGCLSSQTVQLVAEVSPPGNYQYAWTGPAGFFSNASNPTTNKPGSYLLLVSSPGCTLYDTVVVKQDGSLPTVQISSTGGSGCNVSEVQLTAVTNSANSTFLWSNSQTTKTINVPQGTYCVTVTNEFGCTATACRTVVLSQSFTAKILSPFLPCIDSLGMFVQVSGGTPPFAYTWSTGANGAFILPVQSGQYCVTATDANGCTATGCYFLEIGSNDCGSLEGKIFADWNLNCVFNANTDAPMPAATLSIKNAAGVEFFAISDNVGNYSLSLPAGAYTVTVVQPAMPWKSCQPVYSVTVPFGGITTLNVGLQAQENCPLLTVDAGVNRLRRCFTNDVQLVYCNTGTTAATGAYVDVSLEAPLVFSSATLPHQALGNNVYRFNLGNIPALTCGSFKLSVFVPCDAELGLTACVDAVIYPHDPCPTASNKWSGASLNLSAECTGTELIFRAKNLGTANMSQALDYVVIEDAVIIMMGPAGDTLKKGEEKVLFSAPANGSTWRMEARQEPFHPGKSLPSVAVEGCTTGTTFSKGFINQFPADDADVWKDSECQEIRGSYDPNDKQGLPKGYGQAHYIRPGVDLEYLIRFQNTGNDTAFRVVIRDTLSAWLDPATVVPGASSHPYRFSFYGQGLLKFEFDPIALPDSNVNNSGSQGYVSFRVSQKPNVPLETDIYNRAAIYFDGNEAIYTNRTQHRVGTNFVTVSTWTPLTNGLHLLVAPNPATDHTFLQLQGLKNTNPCVFELLDGRGRTVLREETAEQQFRMERGQLPAGIYLIRVFQDGRPLGTGKIQFN